MSLSNASIIPLRKKGHTKRIYFIHALSGLGFEYYALSSHIQEYDLYIMNDPSLDDEKCNFASLQEMATSYVNSLVELHPADSYLFVGWSFGGLIAYEMAYQLCHEKPTTNVTVIMIDTPYLPKYPMNLNITRVKEYIISNGIKESSELFKKLYSQVIHNMELAKKYEPIPNQNANIYLLKARDSLGDEYASFAEDKSNGWDMRFIKPENIFLINGNHLSIFHPENISSCTDKLKVILCSQK